MKTKILSVSIMFLWSIVSMASSVGQETKKERTSRLQGNKNSEIVITPIAATSLSPEKQYELLGQKQQSLKTEIEAINVSISQLKHSKAKKAMKRVQQMELELASVNKAMSMFPKTITDKNYADQVKEQQKQKFLEELNAKTDQLIASNDPFAGRISLDPELEATYRKYLAEGGAVAFGVSQFDQSSAGDVNKILAAQGKFFSVLFAISDKPINASQYPYNKVFTQKLKNGKWAYFAGAFDDQREANKVCTQILSKSSYRDSFVVLVK